jgi:hypothetical protein
MSSTRQISRPIKVKRGSEELMTPVALSFTSKRQRIQATETDLIMPAATRTIDKHRTTLNVYEHMLPKSPEGRAFLFSPRFSGGLQVPAERIAIRYQVTNAEAIEEFRRLIAIKTFTVDEDATKISHTPIRTQNVPYFTPCLILT